MVKRDSQADGTHTEAGSASAPSGVAPQAASRTKLRDNLESIAMAILLVLVIRQMVVEAFKIPTGSMAPTLLGVHKEVRCPNCGWVFRVGYNKLQDGLAECPNCLHNWRGASNWCGEDSSDVVEFRRPAWLWHEGRCAYSGEKITGANAANRVDRWGSRIFVNKFIYQLRKPRRWEVVVFLYPYCKVICNKCGQQSDVRRSKDFKCPRCDSTDVEVLRKNYIKRLIGLPQETIVIQNGDIYVNGEIARKPPGVQKRMWQHVFDSRFVPRTGGAPWDFGSHANMWRWHQQDGSLTVNALTSEEPLLVTFDRPITDLCAYNGSTRSFLGVPLGQSGRREVGDCRLEALISVQTNRPSASLVLRIVEDGHEFSLSLPAGEGQRAVLRDGGKPVAEGRMAALQPDERVRVVLENYDDIVVVKVRGKTLIRYEYAGNPWPTRTRKAVAFGAVGAKVLFHHVRIKRDIYYLDMNQVMGKPNTYDLDRKSYFVLGDNSPASSDSRAWSNPQVPEDNLLGTAMAVFWPIHDIALLPTGAR